MKEEYIHKTTFRFHYGHFKFLVMHFRLINTSTTFHSIMNKILRELLQKFLLVFFDDILVSSKTWEEHLCHQDHILKILQEHIFYAQQSKCEFGMIGILGHIINHEGVRVDEHKITTI